MKRWRGEYDAEVEMGCGKRGDVRLGVRKRRGFD